MGVLMARFQPGDRVTLNKRAAVSLNNNMHPGRIDWRGRCGVIGRISRHGAFVLWDGRRSLDPIPLRWLVKIAGAAEERDHHGADRAAKPHAGYEPKPPGHDVHHSTT
jgi:hypothetical protein